jgi:hypothetical protein
MEQPATIIWLVEQAVREWVLAASDNDQPDLQDVTKESAYSVFYMDEARPNQIQAKGADRDRCGIWIEPCDVRPENGSAALLVDVKVAHRLNGQPTVTEFQVSLTEDLKALVH